MKDGKHGSAGPGGGRSAFSFNRGKLRTDIDRRLTWVPQIGLAVGLLLGFLFCPAVDGRHPASSLEPLFLVVITVLGAFGLVLLLYQRGNGSACALRFLRPVTALYVIGGIGVSVGGVLPWSNDGVYRYLLAGSAGTFIAFMSTVGLVSVAHIRGQLADALEIRRAQIAAAGDALRSQTGDES